jgi:hypothetical protein
LFGPVSSSLQPGKGHHLEVSTTRTKDVVCDVFLEEPRVDEGQLCDGARPRYYRARAGDRATDGSHDKERSESGEYSESMKYFKVISSGKILCTFLRCEGMRHEVVYRCDHKPNFPEYDPGFACEPSFEYPKERNHGEMIEISESEAIAIDPELFKGAFEDYEEMKRLEPVQKAPALAKKRRVIRERATTQATLF